MTKEEGLEVAQLLNGLCLLPVRVAEMPQRHRAGNLPQGMQGLVSPPDAQVPTGQRLQASCGVAPPGRTERTGCHQVCW